MMIIGKFFDFYFRAVRPEVRELYQALVPAGADMADFCTAMFTRHDPESIEFVLEFNEVTRRVRDLYPDQLLMFNVHNNVCFPFFVDYVLAGLDPEGRAAIAREFGSDAPEALTEVLRASREERNRFRRLIEGRLKQEDLFALNEIISLQCFSSGGEYSFLRLVYPSVKEMEGRVLDAGCGAGFASLVMSQFVEVAAIDACRPRVERAAALAEMMARGDRRIFPRVIGVIEAELGEILTGIDFPRAEELLSGRSRGIEFHCGSLDALPYPDAYFDAVNCLDVLEHTYDPEAIIEQYRRVTRPGARVFITVPTRYGAVEQKHNESADGSIFPAMLHMHHWTEEDLTSLFARHGFSPVSVEPFDYQPWDEFARYTGEAGAEDLPRQERVPMQIFAVFARQ